MDKGYIHVYTGDGKGKTTAAVGLAARAAGQGLKVAFFQFLKSGFSGEMMVLSKAGVSFVSPQKGVKFVCDMTDEEKAEYKVRQTEALERAIFMSDTLDVLVLDEVIGAYNEDVVDRELLMNLIQTKPAQLELVLTGRKANEEFINAADYVTEMKCIKHPYDKGILARKGIEF